MRFLHLSDLHFGKSLFDYSLLEDQLHWCVQLTDFLRANPHDAVVIAGDLYDRAVPSAEAVALCDRFLTALTTELKLPVLCIAGNHDSPRRLDFGRSLLAGGGLHICGTPTREITRVTLRDTDGPVNFFLAPYFSTADAKTIFAEQQQNIRSFSDAFALWMDWNAPRIPAGERNVIIAHGFFASTGLSEEDAQALRSDSEISVGTADLVDSSLLSPFCYAALGHLHRCQQAGNTHQRYCGSPLAYSVSEEKDRKCVLSVTLDLNGFASAQQIYFEPLRQVRTISGTLEQLLAPSGGCFASDDYVLIRLLSDTLISGAAERLKNAYPHYLAIRYVSETEQQIALGEHARLAHRTIPDAFDAFFSEVTGRSLTEAEMAWIAETSRKMEEETRQ